jgi:predicted nucleic acid-binding protein
VTVIDSSGVVDYLLGMAVAEQVRELIESQGELAAPDLLIFEVLAVLRREALRGSLAEHRAAAAVEDLGDVQVELFPSLALRERAWSLRNDLTVADGLFVALAEQLREPLATKDRALAAAVAKHTGVEVLQLAPSS